MFPFLLHNMGGRGQRRNTNRANTTRLYDVRNEEITEGGVRSSFLDNIQEVNPVGKIDLSKFAGIADNIVTDEVIITSVLKDYKNLDEAVLYKYINALGRRARVILILQKGQEQGKKNSIVSLQVVREATLKNNLKNTERYKVVYKRKGL